MSWIWINLFMVISWIDAPGARLIPPPLSTENEMHKNTIDHQCIVDKHVPNSVGGMQLHRSRKLFQ